MKAAMRNTTPAAINPRLLFTPMTMNMIPTATSAVFLRSSLTGTLLVCVEFRLEKVAAAEATRSAWCGAVRLGATGPAPGRRVGRCLFGGDVEVVVVVQVELLHGPAVMHGNSIELEVKLIGEVEGNLLGSL